MFPLLMAAPETGTIHQLRFFALLFGAFAGYLLVMRTNPVRASFLDGFRAIRRYSHLWIMPGVFGFFLAVFQLAQRIYLATILPPEDRPMFLWARAAWKDKDHWLSGSEESLWWLTATQFRETFSQAIVPGLESVASLFNCLTSTFPLSALAAFLLLVNFGGHRAVLWRALGQRFGKMRWFIQIATLVCACAAMVKPFLYWIAQHVPGLLWLQWSPVVAWLSFLFEYLFGVFIQIYLILLAYLWVRGRTFTHSHLIDFSLRRFSMVVKWAALVLVLSTCFIDLPLILKNFAATAGYFPEEDLFATRLVIARAVLAVFLLLTATMQITLVFHSATLRHALGEHFHFVLKHGWKLAWFLIVSVIHCYAMHALNLSISKGVGEGTALWVTWTLIFPWLAAWVMGWLIASWVCVYQRCEDKGRSTTQTWFQF